MKIEWNAARFVQKNNKTSSTSYSMNNFKAREPINVVQLLKHPPSKQTDRTHTNHSKGPFLSTPENTHRRTHKSANHSLITRLRNHIPRSCGSIWLAVVGGLALATVPLRRRFVEGLPPRRRRWDDTVLAMDFFEKTMEE